MTSIEEDLIRRRLDQMLRDDPQLAAARPDPTLSAARDEPNALVVDIVHTIMDGYAERPALGQRAVDYLTDGSGRTRMVLQPRFETITYAETARRARALAASLTINTVRPGDRVVTLGFTSADYAVVDLALALTAGVAVPLQGAVSSAHLAPIIAETEPVAMLTSIEFLDLVVDLASTVHPPRRVVVFDYHRHDDDQREAFQRSASALADLGVLVDALDDIVSHDTQHLDYELPRGGPDDLRLLLYTSGSTGTPKAAMFSDRRTTASWRARFNPAWDTEGNLPAITLNFLPLSHSMGRAVLYSTLGAGGTAYFTSSRDLSTLLDDLGLVRPTKLELVPRIWEMLSHTAQRELDRRRSGDEAKELCGSMVMREVRDALIGGRHFSAITSSAPISPELHNWVEQFLGIDLMNSYGSTEAGAMLKNEAVLRPPVIDYQLVDVPELGYFASDRPHPRGELWIKTTSRIIGYYKRAELTAAVFDADGWYHTGDVFAEIEPDRLRYVDRRNNVVKLSQGEFVTMTALEAAYGGHPSIRQLYLYANSARAHLLAVVVPTESVLDSCRGNITHVKTIVAKAIQEVARESGLQSYELPRDFLIETSPFTTENGLLTGIGKLARPQLKEHYQGALEALYDDLSDAEAEAMRQLRLDGASRPLLETVTRAASALLGSTSTVVAADTMFTDMGGDSLSALAFANMLRDVFEVDVPVGVIVSPANDLAAVASHIEAQLLGRAPARPTFDAVHGVNATTVRASDIALDAFLDAATLAAAPALPTANAEANTVLLTGTTGFLGRYLALFWLTKMSNVGGTVICLVRARTNSDARARLDEVFDTGDAALLGLYRSLSDHLEVLAGDKSEERLGLDDTTWQRLADSVDLIVDPAALVNHVLPYHQLFDQNVVGTAELLRIALTTTRKPYVYVSTIAVGQGIEPGLFVEEADIRHISPMRTVGDGYANGYANSKWAGEVLLREAHDLCSLPVSVFRCDMILADTTYAGQLNLPDMVTRLVLSLVATGIAPYSFYECQEDGSRSRAHFDALPVGFVAEAIGALVATTFGGFRTYHVMNPHDDGISLDTCVDWLVDAGQQITRIPNYSTWLRRFETALHTLPEAQRRASLLPLLHHYKDPRRAVNGSMAPVDQFRAAVRHARIGPTSDIPRVTPAIIANYVTNLQQHGML